MVRHFARRNCSIERRPNEATKMIDLVVRLGEPDPQISLLFGDAVHNMRSALDHLVYELVASNQDRPAGVPNHKTMFPICDTRTRFQTQAHRRGRITGVPVDACAVIERAQPFHRREAGQDHRVHPLWVLNQLDNIDKHRRLTLTAGMPLGHQATITRADGTVSDYQVLKKPDATVHDGDTVWSFQPPAAGEGELEIQGTLVSTVAFNEADVGLVNVDAAGILWQIWDRLNDRLVPELGAFL
jgi:hypothetical protein